MDRLCRWLESLDHSILTCRDPGSTALGEAVRALLLDRDDLHIDRISEMFLYMTARSQLVQERIRPALAEGKTVVCDRYLLANIVYQGYARGLDTELIRRIGQTATGGLEPDVTIVLDMPPEAAAARLNRPLDRMELQGVEFNAQVREGFLTEAAKSPKRIVVVNADQTVEQVEHDIQAAIRRVCL